MSSEQKQGQAQAVAADTAADTAYQTDVYSGCAAAYVAVAQRIETAMVARLCAAGVPHLQGMAVRDFRTAARACLETVGDGGGADEQFICDFLSARLGAEADVFVRNAELRLSAARLHAEGLWRAACEQRRRSERIGAVR